MRDRSGCSRSAAMRALRRRHYAAPATRLLPFGDANFPSYAVRGARAGPPPCGAATSSSTRVRTSCRARRACSTRFDPACAPTPIALAVRTAAGGTLTAPSAPTCRYADGTLLVDDDEVDAVVLGSLFMRDLVLEFDLDRKELGIAPFRP